jgi:hypothetical protein
LWGDPAEAKLPTTRPKIAPTIGTAKTLPSQKLRGKVAAGRMAPSEVVTQVMDRIAPAARAAPRKAPEAAP